MDRGLDDPVYGTHARRFAAYGWDRVGHIFAVSAATDGRHLLPHVSQHDALRRSLCLFRHRLRFMGRRSAKSARRGVHYDLHDPAIRTLSLHQSNKNKENKLV